MTRIELQKEKASIINRLMMIDDAELIHQIKELVSKKTTRTSKFSPAALSMKELKEKLAEQADNPCYLSHNEVMQKFEAQWS